MSTPRAYVEHVAIWVKDIHWHIRFFHDPQQKSQISNSVRMYKNHPDGLSRLLYGQNLKQMYRKFERVRTRISQPA